MSAWTSTDGVLKGDASMLGNASLSLGSSWHGPVVSVPLAYDPDMDQLDCEGTGVDLTRLRTNLRAQLDELRNHVFKARAEAGLRVTLPELLWCPRLLTSEREGLTLFVVPVLHEGDHYPREVRYGVVGALPTDDESLWSALVFDGVQLSDDSPWLREDGSVSAVLELHVATAPVADGDTLLSPWRDEGVDAFLRSAPRDRWVSHVLDAVAAGGGQDA
jgi:hypothetical protein